MFTEEFFFCRQARLPPAPTPAESHEEIRVRELRELEEARRQEDERILGEVSVVVERLILSLEEIRVRELRELQEVSVGLVGTSCTVCRG